MLADYLPFYDKLSEDEKTTIKNSAEERILVKGTKLYPFSGECIGVLLVKAGQIRAYITSEGAREITLYRLIEHDLCLFSASCMMKDIDFEIQLEIEKDADVFVIPPYVYKELMETNADAASYTNRIMQSRFSEVVWLIDKILFRSMDRRLATFLLEESSLEGSPKLKLTHEKIANHLGSAREVVSRLLSYFQSEGYITLSRGSIEILDSSKLYDLSL